MKVVYTFLLIILWANSFYAQAYEGPYAQITNGYGAFGIHPIAEKKFNNAFLLSQGHNVGDDGVEITIRYASDVQGPMPTVLFASGWSQYDPATFDKLLDFIASKGYVVVFTPYPSNQSNSSWETSLYNGMKQAIDENSGVNAGDLNIIDKTRIGFFGHSLGAGDIFWLGHKFYVDHGYGTNDKFLFSVAGWIGFNLTESMLSNYPSDCKLHIQIWEEDDHDVNANPPGGTSPRIQYYLFNQINIPNSEKNYVKVLGGPDQNGYHYSTKHNLVTMDQYNALDFYAIFRPLDAMMDYTFGDEPAAKNLALGFDTDMGPFPDLDTDYNTFVFAYDESTYQYQCDVAANPFQAECPAAPLPITVLEPLSGRVKDNEVYLSWATAIEQNNKGFGIQRSRDGVSWDELGWVDGKGSIHVASRYRAVDKAPMNGVNYYRYEQVDFDGSISHSNVIAVDYKLSKMSIRLAPNPAKNQVTITIDGSGKVEQVVIRTLAGVLVSTYKSDSKYLDVSGLSAGVYVVTVQVNGNSIEEMLVIE